MRFCVLSIGKLSRGFEVTGTIVTSAIRLFQLYMQCPIGVASIKGKSIEMYTRRREKWCTARGWTK